MLRSILVLPFIGLATVVYGIAVSLHMIVFRDRNVFFLYARHWARLLLRVAGVRVHLNGVPYINPSERYVYVSNHASLFDIPVLLATIPDNVRIMYKRELERIPLFGWVLRWSPFIAIDRNKSRSAASQIDDTIASMATGSSVIVFPEGTRSLNATLGEFRRGAFVLAARSGRPIVPVVLVGTNAIMPARSYRLRSGSVTCSILEPLVVPQPPTRADEVQALQHVYRAMQLVLAP